MHMEEWGDRRLEMEMEIKIGIEIFLIEKEERRKHTFFDRSHCTRGERYIV